MDQHSIMNLKNSIDRLDAVNKAYADRIKYKTASGNIPNTVLRDHILFTFPTGKAFANGKNKYARSGLNGWQIIIIIIIIITQIYNARNVIITILKHHKMNLRRGQFAG